MFRTQGARYRSMRKLLLCTYCWGLIPIACMIFYLEDGGLLARPRCAVVSFLHSRGMLLTKAGMQYSSRQLTPACCASPGVAHSNGASGGNPVLLYSDFGTDCGNDAREGKDCRSGCVYGMDFGAIRGPATLSVGAAPLAAYEKWADPGAPYASGHYAVICGRISDSLHSGTLGVQLTTRFASSNTLLINLRDNPLLLVEAPSGQHSEP